jgi:acyl carrier protein
MPSTDLDTIAHSAWEDTLGMPVSQETDFFDAGGHSFIAIQIAVRLEESLGTKVPARLVFDHPVFADYVTALNAFTQ